MKPAIRFTLRKRLHAATGPMDLELEAEVGQGEFVSVFGPSGAGKTTLLRMLAGLSRPDAGRIEVGGETWFDSAAGVDWPARRRRAGLVFQDYALFPNMTVRGNLEYALPEGGDRDRVEALLQAVRLTGLADRRPDTLSGGQKQRVALARALAAGPSLLLLDEPLAALDQAMRRELQDEIASLQRRYALPALLVSHDLGEVFRLSARVLCLEAGRLARQGRPAELFGGGRMSAKLRLSGTLLSIEAADVVKVLTVLVGNEAVRVTALPADAEGLAPGDRVFLAAKGFNPMVIRAGPG